MPPKTLPILNSPAVIKWFLAIMFGLHLIQEIAPDSIQIWIWQHFAFTPAAFTLSDRVAVSPLLYFGPFTHSFLHFDWMHLFINAAMLLIFGTAVARMLGPWRTILIFVLGSLSGAMMLYILTEGRLIFLLGASDSIAAFFGVLTGFSLIPALRPYSPPPFNQPRFTLTFLIIWLVINLIPALLGSLGVQFWGNVSWQAHLGGFALGLVYAYGIYWKYR